MADIVELCPLDIYLLNPMVQLFLAGWVLVKELPSSPFQLGLRKTIFLVLLFFTQNILKFSL